MAVRDALLTILTAGPAYGFQLHGGLAARTGGRRTVNVGQTYATLERLAKQRLIEPAGSTDDGLPLHGLTAAGHDAARAWLDGADAPGADPWDETVDRVLIARSLPDCDADAVVAAERRRWQERRSEVPAAAAEPTSTPSADEGRQADAAEAELAGLVASAEVVRADAALAWLDEVEGRERMAFPPRAVRPKRGRRPAAPAAPAAPTEPGDAQASAIA